MLPPEVPSGTISFHWGTYRGVDYVSVTLGKAIGSPGALLKELDEQGACRRKMTAFLTSLQFSALGGTLIVDVCGPWWVNPPFISFIGFADS